MPMDHEVRFVLLWAIFLAVVVFPIKSPFSCGFAVLVLVVSVAFAPVHLQEGGAVLCLGIWRVLISQESGGAGRCHP